VLRGSEARLFAGAGVVAGSDPESELRETRLKLRALLAPLMEI
jgi:menaquinone-specific isochorismate synthase